MIVRQRIFVRGIVQGIGFRPWVYNLAVAHRLGGFVGNSSAGAFLEIEGSPEATADFVRAFRQNPPPLARIDTLEVSDVAPRGDRSFAIAESEAHAAASTPVSPDVATCEDCLRELRDPADRRHGYPFINCTNCGPRFTIVEDIPYDRPLTTMRAFPMCPACEAEYRDPENRRFHAQPNACWDCGPTLWLRLVGDRAPVEAMDVFPQAGDAIAAARQLLREGRVLAVKGIGGYHLACDASSDQALDALRERKGRVAKPFALMARNLDSARRFVKIDSQEAALLSGRERPILLLVRRDNPEIRISPLVAPGNDFLGLMLPYSPLHHLLLGDEPLVMTSANLSDEPIVRTNEEALERLAHLADAFLMHNRGIHVVADDSVVRLHGGRELPVRRSRGYAPLPVKLPSAGRCVFAAGAELKSTFCIARDEYAFLSQHIGDLGSVETQEAFERAVQHFLTLFRAEPDLVACDLHPAYQSSAWARRFAQRCAIPVLEVQHHEAHVAALLAEHRLSGDEPFLGVAFDGTGYGHDGAIWGGEFLLFRDGAFERAARLRYIPLPGGDSAIRHPWRVAVAHLRDAGIPPESYPHSHDEAALRLLLRQMERDFNCTPTSSMGRLFDAVAAVLGIRRDVSYEGQAAIEMEALCHREEAGHAYRFAMEGSQPFVISPHPMWRELLADQRLGLTVNQVAARFHAAVARMVREVCERVQQSKPFRYVGLTGGVFQNVLLLSLCQRELESAGLTVFTHQAVPPNDGGIALGQVWLARRF